MPSEYPAAAWRVTEQDPRRVFLFTEAEYRQYEAEIMEEGTSAEPLHTAATLAQAVRDERERCARLAKSQCSLYCPGLLVFEEWCGACLAAVAIRVPDPPEEER